MHKTFMKELEKSCGPSRGNVISDTQTSFYIRPFSQTECNGFTREPGVLRDFDLKPFIDTGLPQNILKDVKFYTQHSSAILYRIFHYDSRKKQQVHGYILTDAIHRKLKIWYTNTSSKSVEVMDYVADRLVQGRS